MVAMVFMILYLIAVVATISLFIVAWMEEGSYVAPKGAVILIAIVCGIAWPIVAVGILAYVVKYGMLDEEEES